jgi:hypothetical protein
MCSCAAVEEMFGGMSGAEGILHHPAQRTTPSRIEKLRGREESTTSALHGLTDNIQE